MAGKIGPVAPILPAPEKEDLDRGLAARLMRRHDIGVCDALHIDVLLALDMGKGADAVADERGGLEIECLGGRLHVFRQGGLDILSASAQEVARLGDEANIVFLVDATNAGRATALDLVEQAGSRSAGEHTVAARTQKKGSL